MRCRRSWLALNGTAASGVWERGRLPYFDRPSAPTNRSVQQGGEQGLFPAELEAWKRDAIAGLGEPRAASAVEARQDRRRVKELERELHRKDKALAETAALLVLRKNGMQSSTTARTHGPPGG